MSVFSLWTMNDILFTRRTSLHLRGRLFLLLRFRSSLRFWSPLCGRRLARPRLLRSCPSRCTCRLSEPNAARSRSRASPPPRHHRLPRLPLLRLNGNLLQLQPRRFGEGLRGRVVRHRVRRSAFLASPDGLGSGRRRRGMINNDPVELFISIMSFLYSYPVHSQL